MKLCPVVDGKAYATVAEAQAAELAALFGDGIGSTSDAIKAVLGHANAVLHILDPDADLPKPAKARKARVTPDWSITDWGCSDAAIAKATGAALSTVRAQRRKHNAAAKATQANGNA